MKTYKRKNDFMSDAKAHVTVALVHAGQLAQICGAPMARCDYS
jgi:hypothetical protein